MGDHLVVCVDRLSLPVNGQLAVETAEVGSSVRANGGGAVAMSVETAGPSSSLRPTSSSSHHVDDGRLEAGNNEDDPLIRVAECRICQDEDSISNLETPCACSGSVRFAHRKCVQQWCNEKRDIICEICHQPYQPGYTAPPPRPHPEETTIDIGGWTISGTPLELRDPHLLAIAEAESQFLEAEYDEYAASNASGAAFCRSAALILMALLLLRHALSDTDSNADDDPSAFFSFLLLRAAEFLLPCYIMAWAISILQRRRQRQEAAALAATQVAFVLQSGRRIGLQFGLGSGSSMNQQEHV